MIRHMRISEKAFMDIVSEKISGFIMHAECSIRNNDVLLMYCIDKKTGKRRYLHGPGFKVMMIEAFEIFNDKFIKFETSEKVDCIFNRKIMAKNLGLKNTYELQHKILSLKDEVGQLIVFKKVPLKEQDTTTEEAIEILTKGKGIK